MRGIIYIILCVVLVSSSCAALNKKTKSSSDQTSETNKSEAPVKTTLMPATPIREVEEKLVPDNNKAPDNHKYFVIIGSFKNHGNAVKQQKIVSRDGFSSEILKNAEGLYRVSVKATDDVNEARDEVRRIWAKYPEYSDTWMLIQIK